MRVEHDEVGLFAHLERPDLVVQAERLGASQGRKVEHLVAFERVLRELRDLVRLVHRREQRELVPAPMSVPNPTLIGWVWFLAWCTWNRPLPRNRFDVGQCDTAAPVSCTRSRSAP